VICDADIFTGFSVSHYLLDLLTVA